ncbi:MAG: hypothetical protein HKN31_04605, partial [Pricia sp.]|nr:hypothetical protein [Pricia sp.]
VNLDEILVGIEQDLELLISESNVKINAEPLGSIQAVPTQIYQLFSNLIKNAIKFNENEPVLTISATTIEGKAMSLSLNGRPDVIYKKLQFTDNGIGIDTIHQDKIFKPFKRLHSRNEYSGTGIGLALCKRITEIHQGFIEVDKNAKEGSTFTVYLPLNQ